MIPDEKQPAVTRALHTAFGVNEYEDIRPLTGGLSSALAFRIVVRETPYLLKILRTEIISNPAHEFACMKTAAQAGIAPKVWYANIEDRILITDFVESKPFPDDMALRLAPMIRRLHSLPDFPKPIMGNYFDAGTRFIQRFQAAKLLPDSATDEVFSRYAKVIEVYPRIDAELVASHNDVKPQNMRFDGDQIWLVDWESAFLNDEYVDLGIIANFFVKDEAHEADYLAAYFGQPASEYQRSRFFLMRQTLSMFYAALLLMEASQAGIPIDADIITPDFKEFHQGLVLDEINVLNAEVKLQYGILHLREALRNMRTPRFEEALAVVSQFHATV